MSDVTATVDTYLTMLNETDPARRAILVAEVWTEDGRWIDPPIDGEGHAGINDMLETIHGQFPGHTFRRTSAIDAHHGYLRFAWELVAPDGGVTVVGLDVGELSPDGRLRRITGFLGDLAAEAAA